MTNFQQQFNKHDYNNIFTFFILNDRPPSVGHDILNSRSNDQQKFMEIDKIANYTDIKSTNYIQVNCKVAETDIQIKRDLPLFETLSQDLFQAIKSFRKTVALTNWSDKTILQVLKILCSDEFLEFINQKSDF
ncbi:hypothetical protein DMUE_5307 [Dictyocoela muelleri]|nr:hypothetical protein DMUE_5307 [Dictyocoela muelleri]